jgi:hypothetical protein
MVDGHVFHKSLDEMEQEFRRFRESTIEEYEQELERYRAEREARREEELREEAERRHTLVASRVDIDGLDRMEEAERGKLDDFLRRVRPRFIEGEAHNDRDLREGAIRSAFYSRFGWKQANLIGADLLAPDRESLKGVEGEVGNPSAWLYNANKVKYSRADSGSGWGCFSNYGFLPLGRSSGTTVGFHPRVGSTRSMP